MWAAAVVCTDGRRLAALPKGDPVVVPLPVAAGAQGILAAVAVAVRQSAGLSVAAYEDRRPYALVAVQVQTAGLTLLALAARAGSRARRATAVRQTAPVRQVV